MIQQYRKGKKGKSKSKRKKVACWNCGERDHQSWESPIDKQDNSWTDGGARKNQKCCKACKDAGKGWDAGKSSWNNCGNSKGRGKDWNGNGKVRTDGMTGSRLRGKARAARNAAAKYVQC